MSTRTGIEWCTATWNPIVGCTRVSSGCEHCYAERTAKRMAACGVKHYQGLLDHNGRWNGNVALAEHKLQEPFAWKSPQTVFVNSMGDLFHENVPFTWISRVMCTVVNAPWHMFIVLTKRPDRMREYFSCGATLPPQENLALGVSVEDKRTADERIPLLLQTPARWRFVSYEPALGPVEWRTEWLKRELGRFVKTPQSEGDLLCHPQFVDAHTDGLDGIIMGGESGKDARPMHPDWARATRDACADAWVNFFFKQWGEWHPLSQNEPVSHGGHIPAAWQDKCFDYAQKIGAYLSNDGQFSNTGFPAAEYVLRVGKRLAGRLLDGREHNDLPWEARHELSM